ncbi:hypothetical protein [Albidovulum inexpectatum]|nr:hypothetical protein [Albidovulum inexpectatum]
MRSLATAALAAMTLLLAGTLSAAELRLIMVEQPGCIYCARWDAQIAPIYPKTPEGRIAPLERVQLRGPYPPDVRLQRPPTFTPTFILVADGAEVGRIEGYPGEDFFWGLLDQLLQEAGAWPAETGQ